MSDLNKNNLPVGWEIDDYANIVTTISTNGKKVNQKQYEVSGKYPVIDQGKEDCSGYCNDEEKVIDANFPILVFGDHTRTVKSINNPFVAGADGVKVLQPSGAITPKLLFYFTQYLAISIKDKGYARHYQWVAKELIGIPPENEQIRIVEKIEELFSELDKGIECLKTAKAQLAVYRQALLKHAFEGKLTEEWRASNADKLESPEQLLIRIQQERESRYQRQLNDWKQEVEQWEADGKEGKKPTKPSKPKDLPAIEFSELELLPDIPKEWAYERLAHISFVGSGMSVSKSRKLEEPIDVSYLRVANVQRGQLILDEIKEMPVEKSKLKDLRLKKWDVLFNEGGDRDKLGRGWIWEDQVSPCITQNHVFRASTYIPTEYHAKFISHWGNTFGRDYFEKGGKQTTNLASINKTVLSMFPVPVPCFQEQKEIILKLDDCFSFIDKIEAELIESERKSEALRQSILKKAFSGQLVSQDPNDEPAIELLKKIAIEKAELAEKEKAEKAAARKAKAAAKKAKT
ncbi:restriction endonuclease subunit S [Catenovulum maritimum]|uniref:restriction endonuclease subunit S n=1 Tax=Catenovulum maritimum TaxID=1513271 RepID=UPI00066152C8|nr:restriction endonuclease subunit S [Catenovulum maritimum]